MSNNTTSHLIGVHWDSSKKKKVIGFRILGMPSQKVINFVPLDKLTEILKMNPNGIDGIQYNNGELIGSNGQFSRYPAFVNGKPIDNGKIIILGTVGDLGYEVYTPDNKVLTLRNSDVIGLVKKFGIANGKLSSKDKTEFISSISGEYLVSPKTEQLNRMNSIQSKNTEVPIQSKNTEVPIQSKNTEVPIQSKNTEVPIQSKNTEVPIQNKNTVSHENLQSRLAKKLAITAIKSGKLNKDDIDLDNLDATKVINIVSRRNNNRHVSASIEKESRGMNIAVDSDGNIIRGSDNIAKIDRKEKTIFTVDDLMAISMLQLKKVKPFFFAALKVIKRIETTTVPTMGVTIDNFYYNPEFVIKMSIPELNFLHLHEISHIAMKHKVREQGRDPEIWNIACDYYINKAICDEYGIRPGSDPVLMNTEDTDSKVQIEFPKCGGCYNDKIDVLKDTPELIYSELQQAIQQAKGNMAGQSGSGSQGQQGDQRQQGQGKQSSRSQQSQGSGSQGLGQQSGQGRQGQDSGGLGQQNGQGSGGQGSGSQSSGKQRKQGQGSGGQGQEQQSGQGQGSQEQKIYANFRGENIEIDLNNSRDIVSDDSTEGESDTSKEQKAQATIQKIDTIYKKILESKASYGRGKGGLGVVEAFVEKELIPKVNWRSLVQNRLIAKQTDEYSLANPDRRFIHKGVYIEGRVTEEEKIEGIKLCIDTSGSMSDRDIAIAIGQIMQLCKMYDTQADLVYWDDGIQDIIPYDKLEDTDLKRYKAMGRGGTDPNCIFEEFSKNEYKYGLKVAPSLIVIFTDGYFGPVESKYKRAFGKDTIWVLCSENSVPIESFKPTFGRVAKFRK